MADEKKLFFGVSQKEVDEAERKAQQDAEKQKTKAELEAEEKAKRKYYRKFGAYANLKGKVVFFGILNILIGGIDSLVRDNSYIDIPNGEPLVCPKHTFGGALGEAYIPTYHAGSFGNQDFYDANFWTLRDPKGHIDSSWINSRWATHMLLIMVELVILAGVGKRALKRRKDVDMIAKIAKDQGINPSDVKRLSCVADDILQQMAEENRVYFDLLMDDKLGADDKKFVRSMAINIMKGHLESHPEDAKRILNVFNEKSLPSDLLAKCKDITENKYR